MTVTHNKGTDYAIAYIVVLVPMESVSLIPRLHGAKTISRLGSGLQSRLRSGSRS